ncbi:MAG TPA: sulfatase-like hydrolase/transferase [Opitutaceae bacterium]|jgi:arylsulfatase A-like enzyme|nr:sulfatase-like hydrolase/transferase [Opitutaceae bacterium]
MPAGPNILWIVTTQWRAQAMGLAGDRNARTPRLDSFSADCWNFTQAVTPHPFGPFARAAMLTGLRSPENGVRDYFDPLPENSRTIAHELDAKGYATAYFGKWHLGRRDPAAPLVGEAHARTVVPAAARGGFGFWEGFESGYLLNDPWLHGTRLPEPVQVAGYQADVVCDRAAQWLAEKEFSRAERRPWFCVVSLEAPHPPYDAPASGVAPRHPDGITLERNVPRGGEAEARARRELAGYYTHIEAADRAIGRLLDALAPLPPMAVVFTSVHGDMHGAHGLFRKGWPYEESVRVPLLVRTPGGIPAGSKRELADAVTLADLPEITRLLAAGAVSPGPRLPPTRARISMPSVVRLPLQCDRAWTGVRTAQRKLALNADGTPWLFFDLENDPGEMDNLAADPGRAAEIRRLEGLE